jgi:hypothetical protein
MSSIKYENKNNKLIAPLAEKVNGFNNYMKVHSKEGRLLLLSSGQRGNFEMIITNCK